MISFYSRYLRHRLQDTVGDPHQWKHGELMGWEHDLLRRRRENNGLFHAAWMELPGCSYRQVGFNGFAVEFISFLRPLSYHQAYCSTAMAVGVDRLDFEEGTCCLRTRIFPQSGRNRCALYPQKDSCAGLFIHAARPGSVLTLTSRRETGREPAILAHGADGVKFRADGNVYLLVVPGRHHPGNSFKGCEK